MCQRIGWFPIGTIGFGRNSVSSRRRVPSPPHSMKTGTLETSSCKTFPRQNSEYPAKSPTFGQINTRRSHSSSRPPIPLPNSLMHVRSCRSLAWASFWCREGGGFIVPRKQGGMRSAGIGGGWRNAESGHRHPSEQAARELVSVVTPDCSPAST